MAAISNDVFFATISELAARLRVKEFSCVELTRAFTDRFEKLAPQYNAMALSLRKEALSQAKDVDRELKRDRTRGPLQGIPYGAKDLFAVAGHPTTWGARPYAAQVFKEDARVIQKLTSAKAILIGRCAEFISISIPLIRSIRCRRPSNRSPNRSAARLKPTPDLGLGTDSPRLKTRLSDLAAIKSAWHSSSNTASSQWLLVVCRQQFGARLLSLGCCESRPLTNCLRFTRRINSNFAAEIV